MGVRMDTEIVVNRLVIHIKLLIPALNDITGYPDHAFDKIFVRILWEFKDNDVFAPGFFKGNDNFIPVRYFNPVKKFIHQDMIPDLQGLFHGS